jgi:hypothetical protein
MKKLKYAAVVSVFALVLIFGGCDVGVNPLLFDGTPLRAVIAVDDAEPSFDESHVVSIGGILEGIDDAVDSVNVFNITLRVKDRVSPAANTTFSSVIYIDGLVLAEVAGLTLGDFSSERSLFEDGLWGSAIEVNPAGLQHLKNVLNQASSSPNVSVRAAGTVGGSPLEFSIEVTLYTQIYTTP